MCFGNILLSMIAKIGKTQSEENCHLRAGSHEFYYVIFLCSDQNWWKGEGTRGEGLFPANFVTTDLTQPPPGINISLLIPHL